LENLPRNTEVYRISYGEIIGIGPHRMDYGIPAGSRAFIRGGAVPCQYEATVNLRDAS
jgi:hypothetical protein